MHCLKICGYTVDNDLDILTMAETCLAGNKHMRLFMQQFLLIGNREGRIKTSCNPRSIRALSIGQSKKNASQDADSLAGRWPKFSQW